jgi:putative hemolysin
MMKKFSILLAGFFLLGNVFAQKGYKNPTAAYAELLGYRYSIETDAYGNQVDMIVLPNDEKVNAWDFYKGKVAQDYTYGALRGFDVNTEVTDMGGYTVETAVYSRPTKSGAEKYTQDELIELFGDKLDVVTRNDNYDPIGNAQLTRF